MAVDSGPPADAVPEPSASGASSSVGRAGDGGGAHPPAAVEPPCRLVAGLGAGPAATPAAPEGKTKYARGLEAVEQIRA
eukprot:8987141-Alexandrium_andersonii.AAC.1